MDLFHLTKILKIFVAFLFILMSKDGYCDNSREVKKQIYFMSYSFCINKISLSYMFKKNRDNFLK